MENKKCIKENYDLCNDLIKIMNNAKTAKDVEIYDHANMLLRQLNTAGGKEIMGREVNSFIDNNLKYLGVDESTFEFDSNDTNMQQKISKLKNDSTMFDKSKDEIKITNEKKYLIGDFFKMVNEAKKEKAKNKHEDYLKAVKKADRELEFDLLGPGFKSKDKPHKDLKKYDRKTLKKSELIEMFLNEYGAYETRPNSIGSHTGGESRIKGASLTYDEGKLSGYFIEIEDNEKVKRLKSQGVPTTPSLFSDNSHILKTIYNLISRFGGRIKFESLNRGTYILCILDGGEEKCRLNPNCNLGVGYSCSTEAIAKRVERDSINKRRVNRQPFE